MVAGPPCAPLPAPPWVGEVMHHLPELSRSLLHGNLPDFADVVTEMDHNREVPAKLRYLHKHTVCSFGTAGLSARIASFHSASYGTCRFQGGENHFKEFALLMAGEKHTSGKNLIKTSRTQVLAECLT